MLRVSSQESNDEVTLDNVTSGDGLDSGVPHGDILVRLTDATLGDDDGALAAARQAVIDVFGTAGLVDAAGVIAAFTMQNRVADATGLPLDAPMEVASRGHRAKLGLDQYSAAAYINKGGRVRALLARIAEPILPQLMRVLGRRKKSRS